MDLAKSQCVMNIEQWTEQRGSVDGLFRQFYGEYGFDRMKDFEFYKNYANHKLIIQKSRRKWKLKINNNVINL